MFKIKECWVAAFVAPNDSSDIRFLESGQKDNSSIPHDLMPL
jgi:hypothetical protein